MHAPLQRILVAGLLAICTPFASGTSRPSAQSPGIVATDTAGAGLTLSVGASARDQVSGCSQNDGADELAPLFVNGTPVGTPVALSASAGATCSLWQTMAAASIELDHDGTGLHVTGDVQGTGVNVPVTNPPSGGYDASVSLLFTFDVATLTSAVLAGQVTGSYDVELSSQGSTIYSGALQGELPLLLTAGSYTLEVGAAVATTGGTVPALLASSFDLALAVDPDQPDGGKGRASRPLRPGGDLLDRTPPSVSDLVVDLTGGGNVTIQWTTSEPTRGFLDYGTSPAYGNSLDLGPGYASQHSVSLGGLSLDETYHFGLRLRDGFGNWTQTADHTFDTPPLGGAEVSGTRVAWHPLTLSFHGPDASELDVTPNPFLDYRLTVEFSGPSGQAYTVPGFFDGDGNGGDAGDVWRVRFAPDEGGFWTYTARFVSGTEVAVDLNPAAGTPLAFDGDVGTIEVFPRDPAAQGFYKWGKLEYDGGHYPKFRDGPWFVKTGCGSPENLLGYVGFDNTFDQGGPDTTGLDAGRHRFDPHVADFGPAGLGDDEDPFFVSADTGDDSRGIVGALDYLASRHVNGVYFLPMNLGGDGQETCPFVGFADAPFDKRHYDLSKLRQWNMVFEHATRREILLHVVLAETELGNRTWLDGGSLGVERKLFFREMVARFGHCLAIQWNLCEENVFTTAQVEAFAGYLQAIDPYDHPIAFHSVSLPPTSENGQWDAVLGDPHFTANSIQGNISHSGAHVEYWRERTATAGLPWIVGVDEITGGLTDTNAGEYRTQALYDVLFSGGHIEFYLGYFPLPLGGDLRLEDFRTREAMWDYAWYARRFMEENLPFHEMEPMDELVQGEALAADGGGAEVFAKPGHTYAIYFPTASATGTLDLSGEVGVFFKHWYDPRNGVFVGTEQAVFGGGPITLGAPPRGAGSDWVCLVQRDVP